MQRAQRPHKEIQQMRTKMSLEKGDKGEQPTNSPKATPQHHYDENRSRLTTDAFAPPEEGCKV